MKRQNAVAGSFYPGREESLRETIAGCIQDVEKQTAVAVLSPHAGYVYSGLVAGAVFSRVEIPDTVVLIGPMHRHGRTEFALYPSGSWETPLGDVDIDEEFARILTEKCRVVSEDASAHAVEHSLEVQVPFLKYLNPDVLIVPVLISTIRYDALKAFGEGLAASVQASGKRALIVASSDMSHTQSSNPERQERISRLDHEAVARFISLDCKGFHDFICENNITMCGFAPATSAIAAAGELGASAGELVEYRTSYDVTGDYSYVVGYAGAFIK
jgi:AmmeMemoRadiSam system protein B